MDAVRVIQGTTDRRLRPAPSPRRGEGWGEGVTTSIARSPSPQPSPQPNSGLPEFGHVMRWPKSETSDFGWGEGVPPCHRHTPCSPRTFESKYSDAKHDHRLAYPCAFAARAGGAVLARPVSG